MVKSVGIVLLGLGNVGLEVLRQISRGRQVFVDRFGLKVRVIAVGDSSGVLATPSFPQSCIDSKQLEEIIQFKEQKMKLMDFDSTELLKTSCPESMCSSMNSDLVIF